MGSASEVTTMAVTAFLDPNYDPVSVYPQLEGLLLLYDGLDVFAPNGTAMADAAANSKTVVFDDELFFALVDKRFVNPVMRERYIDESWRSRVAQDLADKGDVKRSQFYRFTETDRRLRELPKTIITDADIDAARERGIQLAQHNAPCFVRLSNIFASLKNDRQLPDKYYSVDFGNKELAEQRVELMGDIAGDVILMRRMKSCGHVLPERLTGLGELYDSIGVALSDVGEPSTFDAVVEDVARRLGASDWELTSEDERLAREMTSRLQARYRLVDVLEDYHRSALAKQCRHWIFHALRALRAKGHTNLEEGLIREVEREIIQVRNGAGGGIAGNVVGAMAGAALAEGWPVTQGLLKEISRRRFNRVVLGGAVGALVAEATKYAFESSTSVARSIASGEPSARWITFVVQRAAERLPSAI